MSDKEFGVDYKRANRSFLYMILATLAFTLLLSYWIILTGSSLSILTNNVLSELVVLIPALAAILYGGEKITEAVPFKKIKITTLFMIVVYVISLFPLVSFVNSVSMLFVENMVSSISGEVLAMPMWTMLLSIGIVGPFVEEFVFRGYILHSYQRTGRIIGSIVLSSVLFGMMHLNFNQFAYGTVMGIMFCILVEATGSIWSSFFAHALFNSIEVIYMYTFPDIISEADETLESYGAGDGSTYLMIGIYFVLAVIFTAIALCIVYKISEMENRRAFVDSIRMYPGQGYKLITVPLIIAMVIAFAWMVYVATYL